jgi:glycosyltransferase involved in cell wall biosynthesis
LHPLGIRWAHAIVCRTQDQLNSLAGRYGRKGTLIRTGHALPAEKPSESSSILWIGRLHPVKQPHVLLDIVDRIPGERFVMAAMRHTDYPDLWKGITEQATRMTNIVLHTDVPFDVSDGLFKSVKLLVNTSCSEGFPNTFVQAALNGIPIVSLNVDPDGVLTKGGIGICAEGSLDKLVTAIQLLCNDARTRQIYSVQAAAYAREHHNLDRTVAAFKELFRSFTGCHHTHDAAGVQQ